MPLIKGSLEELGVKCKMSDRDGDGASGILRLRIGGYDRRKMMFKGWVEIERFVYAGTEGSFCMMQRDEVFSSHIYLQFFLILVQGNPISWRQLWKALIKSSAIVPHVLRK